MNITGAAIVRVALLGEGALLLLSLPLFFFSDSLLFYGWSVQSALIGAVATLPLLAFSYGVGEAVERYHTLKYSRFGRTLREFQSEYITPLCIALTWWQALVIGILSGFGEELFFRGFLTTISNHFFPELFTLLLVNFLFALVHFIGQFRRFAPLLPLYTAAGVYFSSLTILSHSLFAPILCHALFNFISIIINKWKAKHGKPCGV